MKLAKCANHNLADCPRCGCYAVVTFKGQECVPASGEMVEATRTEPSQGTSTEPTTSTSVGTCTECLHPSESHLDDDFGSWCEFGKYVTKDGWDAYPCNCGERAGR